MLYVGVAFHVHVDACLGGNGGGVAQIGAMTLRNHLHDGTPVADHHAVPAPFVAQDVAKQIAAGIGRYIVDFIERAHECGGTGFCSLFERRKDDVAQARFGHPHTVVVLAVFRESVGGEMLGAGSHGVRAAEVVGLIAAYHGFAKNRGQVRIFAEPSAMRPHRLSRATSSIGENVQRMPTDEASSAATRAPSSTSAGFQVAACPRGMG